MAKVIIADDASFMRGSLKFILESAGHEVVGLAKDGKEALELYIKLKPDLVILDILMAGMDGISSLKGIMKENPSAKVMMVTALGHEAKRKEAMDLAASGFIRKPFTREEIIAEVERVMGKPR
ncbi:MAG: response regulator [Desulfobacterales bacterium]|nr:response regulator [Desulfobacterales bacterium]